MTGLNNSCEAGSRHSLKIFFISSSFPKNDQDWRSVFIRQMLWALDEKDELKLNYWGPPGNIPVDVNMAYLPGERIWLEELMDAGGLVNLLRNGGIRRVTAPVKFLFLLKKSIKRQQNIDLYHINWLQNVLSLWNVKQPLLITVLGSDLGLLRIPGMTKLIRRIIKNKNCLLAPNAEWMTSELEKLFGDVAMIYSIPLGIDAEWFSLKNKVQEGDPRKWLVVLRITKKKVGPLFEWGKRIFALSKDHELHLFGPMQEEIEIPDWVHYHGATFPSELREKWFDKASGLLTTSRHDEGRPQVMLEAMAAGLPIIATNISAHRNFIKHHKTGVLIDSAEELESAIHFLSVSENYRKISQAARDWVKKEVGTWQDCADRYLVAYHKLLAGRE